VAGRKATRRTILTAIRVPQWLPQWDRFSYSAAERRRKPDPYFYLFSADARVLRRLAGVNRRTRTAPDIDTGIQRRHEEQRSAEIARFVRNGYPFSILSEARREEPHNEALRKPGWLPTALVVNILTPPDARNGIKVAAKDLIKVERSKSGLYSLVLPDEAERASWSPTALPPIEVIDGQHRLFAFDPKTASDQFHLPVVAFVGLDISWQAYLFWTINIKPKKINPSLAFDLYPLLRTEDWLEVADEFSIYRETRAQELVETLWSYPKSPWRDRIDMLGERRASVSQASFIRSLLATVIKRREGKGVSIGGLFGSPLPGSDDALSWSRIQQAAFLILFWQLLSEQVSASKARWVRLMRQSEEEDRLIDPGFRGRHTLLNQDQGVRAALHILNDVVMLRSGELKLHEWTFDEDSDLNDEAVITAAIQSLRRRRVARLVSHLVGDLANFDWRSANATSLSSEERRAKLVYRGGGGYRVLRLDLLTHLSKSKIAEIRSTSREALGRMRREAT
jgi:DGQHR domain-containing protein